MDLEAFHPSAKSCGAPVIGFIKHLLPVYGPDTLIDAFARVLAVRPDSRLWMVGAGPMEYELKQRALRHGIAESIQWLGAVPHQDIPALLAQMTVTVMPSRSEAFGIAALESQAMEVPVVATNVGGIPESVADGETGILTPPNDSETLGCAILKLLNDEGLRRQLGENGRRRVESLFNWRETVDRTISYYHEACSG
ncbi:MAG: glycosyltransferase family 4 protein [Planctomycetota bacterium]|nr:glycosyltransferase family 4 protein [Planctomycetota bacterium]